MDLKEFKTLKFNEIKVVRNQLNKEQNFICPICNITITPDIAVLDHKHNKTGEVGVCGSGLCRGVLCRNCNSWEGKCVNSFSRTGVSGRSKLTYEECLENMTKYLTRGYTNLIHPTEREKAKKLKKREFNALRKKYAIKFPDQDILIYPKNGRVTKHISGAANLLGIDFS